MAKYVVDIDTENPFTDSKGNVIYRSDMGLVCYGQVSTMEPLTAEYVNENFGDLQDQAYQKGLQEGEERKRRRRDHDEQLIGQGRNEAWEAASKIILIWRKTASDKQLYDIFGLKKKTPSALHDLFNAQTAEEAIAKLKAYEQQKADEIKVGDELTYTFKDGTEIEPFVVFKIYDDGGNRICEGYQVTDGRWVGGGLDYKKTGRHFPQIAELLEAMKGGE